MQLVRMAETTCPRCAGKRIKQVSDGVIDGRVRCFCLLCGIYFSAPK